MNRRESLSLIAGAVATLAGCAGFADSASESSSERPGADRSVPDGQSSGTETEPELVLVRAGTDRQPVWLADPDSDDDGRITPRRGHDARHVDSVIIDSASRADRLTVAADVDDDAVESFVAATDFDAETVFLDTVRVEECFRLELCRITWQPEKVSTDYVRRGRPWDELCRADERVFEARLIRIPDAIDADSVTGRSTSVGTGACHPNGDGPTGAGEGGSGSAFSRETAPGTSTGTGATAGGEQ